VKTLEHIDKCHYGQKFKMQIDHSTLVWLFCIKNLERQTALWVHLREYNLTSELLRGQKQTVADALPRGPCLETCADSQKVERESGILLSEQLAGRVKSCSGSNWMKTMWVESSRSRERESVSRVQGF
jgi:hypothetical protein